LAKRSIVDLKGSRVNDTASRKEQSTGLDVKHAVARAMQYFKDLVPSTSDLGLEEVEKSGPNWLITLGYTDKAANPFAALSGGGRAYKVISINAETGEAVSMKIRKP
jgi:hypothetical protein